MLTFYYNAAPNPMKVALYLEEAGLEYEARPLDTRLGEQFSAEYLAINPNAKAPAIVDDGRAVFDSNAILLYLAEKTGQFLPEDGPPARGEMLSWLMFVATGVGPYSGQAVHFKMHAPEEMPYAVNRYDFEAERHYSILNDRLATRPWMLGERYTLVDMAVWGWARLMPRVLGEAGAAKQTNVNRLVAAIDARPAAARAVALAQSHAFKVETDEEARRYMFPQNERIGL